MAGRTRKWSLEDLANFESRLRESEDRGGADARRRYREATASLERWPKGEAARRRLGLRIWLEASAGRGSEEGAGARVRVALRTCGFLLGVFAFLAGIGVLRGLVHTTEMFTRGYNVWLFLAVTLGLQWLFMLGGLAGYAWARRTTGTLSLSQRLASWLARRLAGRGLDRSVWRGLLESGAGYRSAFSWRIARMTQAAAVLFNLGLLAGFTGCLFFLSIRFYWESTFEGSGWGLVEFMRVMATPWSWSGAAPAPSEGEIGYSVLTKVFYEQDSVKKIWPFLMMSLAVYGLLPRALLWLWCVHKERAALAAVDFQAPRHRELWRDLSKAQRTLASSGPGDGVVLVEVGGVNADPDRIREFLLRELRVNPQGVYTAGVLEEEREEEALTAIDQADLGVVLLVEGWALSPKEIEILHGRVRAVGGEDVPVHYLVIGELRDGRPTPPGAEEWEQWKAFVDSLRDPAADVIAYAEPAERGDAS